jgi:hypothetical protein
MGVGDHSGAVMHSRDVIGQFYQAGMTHSMTMVVPRSNWTTAEV